MPHKELIPLIEIPAQPPTQTQLKAMRAKVAKDVQGLLTGVVNVQLIAQAFARVDNFLAASSDINATRKMVEYIDKHAVRGLYGQKSPYTKFFKDLYRDFQESGLTMVVNLYKDSPHERYGRAAYEWVLENKKDENKKEEEQAAAESKQGVQFPAQVVSEKFIIEPKEVMEEEYKASRLEREEEERTQMRSYSMAEMWGNLLFNTVRRQGVTLKEVREYFSDPDFADDPNLITKIVKYIGDDSRTLLMELIANTHISEQTKVDIADLLLQKGVDINWQGDVHGSHYAPRYVKTALMMAAERGLAKVVKLLLDRGADASFRDKNGHDVEWYARESNNAAAVLAVIARYRK